MAAKLYKCRDSARTLLGTEYHEKLKPYQHIIKQVMAANRHCLVDVFIVEHPDDEDRDPRSETY